MKFEEKRKKNRNCEISHMVRPAESLEVYNQKQNTLFISECVEHRRFKVTWARLWVYLDECSGICMAERTGRARGSAVRDARLGRVCVTYGPSTLRCTIISSVSVSFPVKSNFNTF